MTTDTAGSTTVESTTGTNVDAGVAAARRVKHLSAIIGESLGPDPDRETLVGDVIIEVYRVHPAIRLGDCLELVQLIESPADCSTKTAIQTIVDEACTYLEDWGRLGQRTRGTKSPSDL